MTESRKIILAAVLLAAGYCMALFFGGFTDIVDSRAPSPTALNRAQGVLAVFQAMLPAGNTSPSEPRALVPEAEYVTPNPSVLAIQAGSYSLEPTWLKAESSANRAPLMASGPELSSVSSDPKAITDPIRTPSHQPPIAHITNVIPANDQANATSASPWDRWPRWTPNTNHVENPSNTQAVAFEHSPGAERTSVQVPFNNGDLIRKSNSQQLASDHPADLASRRTHIVIDGDSLTKLADRYLDDASREREIFQLNREVLITPELLPIGVELQIPDRHSTGSATTIAASQSFGGGKTDPHAGMIPVEWPPQEFEQPPRAKLLRPVPAGRLD